jgi:hypothetical protein
MAHFWMLKELEGEDGQPTSERWVVKPVTEDTESLFASEGSATGERAVLVRARGSVPAGSEVFALLGSTSVRINSARLATGLKILQDRDQVRIGSGQPSYFSTERLPRVEPFPGAERKIFCPRCKTEIEAGMPAVRCPDPGCGVWHHQITGGNEPLPCWSYASGCSICGGTTSLDVRFRWSPEDL